MSRDESSQLDDTAILDKLNLHNALKYADYLARCAEEFLDRSNDFRDLTSDIYAEDDYDLHEAMMVDAGRLLRNRIQQFRKHMDALATHTTVDMSDERDPQDWMPFALTVESALNRGDDAALLFDENSPIRGELRRLIALKWRK